MVAEEGGARVLQGALGGVQRAILFAIPIIGIVFIAGIHTYLGLLIYTEQYIGVFLTLSLVGTFLSAPFTRKSPRDRLPWYDALLALLSVPVGLFLTIRYPEMASRLGVLSPDRVILGGILILLVLEGLRRTVGWMLVIVVSVVILFAHFANYMPGALHADATAWDRLFAYLYLDPNSMLSLVAIASTIALAFIFFGQVLLNFGGGEALAQLAILGFGRFRGGPAKAAVVASSVVGMMTGGPVVNVMTAGTITIPLMIRSGYPPALAGAIEGIASSGSQIMPPVMGVVAFMIAENLGIPYASVALAAALPAILFYLVLFVQVDLEAGKMNLRGLPKSELPKVGPTLRNGWVVIPCLAVLVYTLFIIALPPATTGVVSGFASLVLLLLFGSGRKGFFQRLARAFEGTGRVLVNLGVVLAGAGFIVGVAGISGLGFNLAYALVSAAHNNLLVLLVLAAIASTILGMGMPTVPAYALVATLVAPALQQMGVPLLAAHLFIFYFAIVSNWTPPVALATIAAAAIARSNPNRTGYIAMRLGILAYIVPFLFVYSPALILKGTPLDVALSAVTAVFGASTLGVGLVGYLRQRVPVISRILLAAAGIALLIPLRQGSDLEVFINVGGAALAAIVLWWEWRRYRPEPAPASAGVAAPGGG